jgi:uncharacterized repeat protein (TIGR01451 family)
VARRVSGAVRALTATALAGFAITVVPGSPAQASSPAAVTCGDSGTPAVVALQDQHFYIDSASAVQLLSGYAGYSVRAGATARSHLWLGFSDFTGGALSLAPQQAASTAVPDLASGAAAAEYVLLTATGPTSTPQTHTVTLYDGPPGSGAAICSRTFTYADVVDTIKALANKVTSVSASALPADAHIGDDVTVTVVGNTGTLGAGPGNDPGVLDYTPNALTGFPASAWRLERTELTISPDGVAAPATYVDRLYLSGASGPARDYTARYTFRAVGPASSSAALKPIQYIASGTQVKHTDQGGTALYALPAVSNIADIAVRKVLTSPASGVLPQDGGTASYRVSVSNVASHSTDLDWLADTLPGGATFVPGSLAIDGHAAADPTVHGQDVTVPGPLPVPASGQTTLTYSVALDATPGRRTNKVAAHYGNVVLDATPDVTDDDPAGADVTVLGSAVGTIADDTAATAANTPVTVDVLANDSASSGLPLHVTAVGTASSGTALLAPDGTVTYTPAAAFSGLATFGYTAGDGFGSGQATVTVTVAPATARDLYSTGKNATLSAASVLANDACTACTVSPTLATPPATGTVTMAANGTFSYVPATNQTGIVTFTYRATDPATRLTADGTVTVNVADLAPDYAVTPNATAVTIPVQANDPGCTNGCKPQAGTAPGRGTVVYSGGSAVYTPTGTTWGLDTFTYGITGSTGSSTIPVTVLVAPPASAATTTYGTAVRVTLPAGGSCASCVYSPATAAAHGAVTVDPVTGVAGYEPAAGFAGSDTFGYQVKDTTTGLRVVGAVRVTVGPDAVDDTATVLLGTTVAGDVPANDFCEGTCTYTQTSTPATGTLTWNPDGTWSYRPGTTIGTVSFTYRITGSVAGAPTDQATVRIAVTGAQDDTADTPADTPVGVAVRANDPCGDCTLTAVSTPTSGTAVASGDTVQYTPAAGFTGQARFTYTLSQGTATTTAGVTVTVMPQAQDDSATTVDGTPVELLPLANDLCSGCVITGLDEPTSGSVSHRGDVVTFTPAALGTAGFGYSASDTWGDPLHGTVTVTVVAAPQLVADQQTTRSDTPVAVDVLANDTCPGCTVSIGDDPQHGTAVVDVTGAVRYTAAPGFSGVDVLGYIATTPSGGWAQAELTITVTPVAHDDSAATGVDAPVSVDVLANDDCTGCAITVGSTAGSAVAAVVAGQILVTPDAGWTGTVAVGYTATDPSTGDSDDAVLTVEVSDARPDAATAAYGDAVTGLDVLANDTCPDCRVVAVTQPSAGTASFDTTTVDWTPSPGFAGLTVFGYTATNADGDTVSSTVRILVAPAVLHVDAVSGTATPITALAAGACRGCTVTLTDAPANGDLDADGTGGFSYTAPDGWTGDDAFGYRITDPVSGLSVSSSITLTVSAPGPTIIPTAALTVAPAALPDPGAAPAAGDALTWTWTLANTGTVTLTDLASFDGCAPVPATLAVDAQATCTTGTSLTQADVDAATAAAALTVTADSTAGPASDSASADVTLPHVAAIAVAATAGAADDAPAAGTVITVTYTETNTGNTTVTDVGVTLGDGTVLACDSTILAPGAASGCATEHTVTVDDVAAGDYDTTGVATASSPGNRDDLTATGSTTTALAQPDPTTGAPDPTTSAADPTSPLPTTDPAPTTSAPVPTSSAPVPTSSAPAPTSSAPVPTSGAPVPTSGDPAVPTGSVAGVVWFDRNGNGARNPREWPLPAVTVRLEPATAGSAQVRVAAATTGQVTTSDAAGRYRFDDVAVGTYRVVAAIRLAGFSYTSDTDGGTDWSVLVQVSAGRTAVARFAALGKGTLQGVVFVAGSDAAVAGAAVRCTWAGYDDAFGTSDDVVLDATADGQGRYVISGVPYGTYSCTGRDPRTGAQSAAVHSSVRSARPVVVELPLRAGTGNPAPTGAPAPASHTVRHLAATGEPLPQLLRLAALMALAGMAVLAAGRRRSTRRLR